jgi:hypothetical protein
MKKTPLLIILFHFALVSLAQNQPTSDNGKSDKEKNKKTEHSIGIGIKAGLNFANVTNAGSINGKSQTGFNIGIFLSPPTKSILSSYTELMFSRQGYNYSSDSTTGSVKLDYLTLAQFLAINITKYVQIQIGGQTSYLLNAKADSSQPSTGNANADKILSFYNRIDYGIGAGVEVHPVLGLLVGARYNLSLANLYKQPTTTGGTTQPSFIPSTSSISLKNNIVQLFVGYRF